MIIFGLGTIVGIKKANFSNQWDKNYHRNFAGPKQGFMDDFRNLDKRDFMQIHGIFGEVIKIGDKDIVIQGKDNIEKVILVNNDTIIKEFRKTITIKDLKLHSFVIIIGEPDDQGQIEANLIRLLPPPPDQTSLRSVFPYIH